MKNTEFKQLLLRAGFFAMACDGEVADSELAELRALLAHSIYFDQLDHDSALAAAQQELLEHGTRSIDQLLDTIETAGLTLQQEIQLMEVLIRMIEADGLMAEGEKNFLSNISSRLVHLTDAALVVHFPRYFDFLISNRQWQSSLQHFSATEFQHLAKDFGG